MVLSPYKYNSHFSLRHLSYNLNREKDVIVSAKYVIAAEPAIQHADTPNVLLVQEGIDGVLSFIGIATQRESYAPSGVKHPPSHDMATQAPALHIETAEPVQSADAEYKGHNSCSGIDGAYCQRTVKDIAAGSSAGAVDTKIPLSFPFERGSARFKLIPMPRSEGRHSS